MAMIKALSCCFLATLGCSPAGSSGGRVYTRSELQEASNTVPGTFGTCVVEMGDIDHDGVKDIAIGVPPPSRLEEDFGYVYFVSGLTGKSIGAIKERCDGLRFGYSLLSLHRDKRSDLLLVGAPAIPRMAEPQMTASGEILVYTVPSLKCLARIRPVLQGQKPDVCYGNQLISAEGVPFTDGTDAIVASCSGSGHEISFLSASAFADIKSIDLDSSDLGGACRVQLMRGPSAPHPNCIIVGHRRSMVDNGLGWVRAVDIESHAIVWNTANGGALNKYPGFGADVVRVSDVDKDGVMDLVVSSSGFWATDRSGVHLLSGRTGAIIRTELAPGVSTYGSCIVGNIGDVDKDDLDDVIVIAIPAGNEPIPAQADVAISVVSVGLGALINVAHVMANSPSTTWSVCRLSPRGEMNLVAVGQPSANGGPGKVDVLRVPDLNVVLSIEGTSHYLHLPQEK
jgi:hypothetical protein